MEYSELINIISTVGFPIVCCIAMFKSLDTERTMHQQETKELTGIISELKIAIQQLTDYIKLGGSKDE